MRQANKSAIVMDPDPQILKGLVLLLEDMQFTVIPTQNYNELAYLHIKHASCPDLLILPFVLNDGTTGMTLVTDLRTTYNHTIPAILLSHNNGLSHTSFIAQDISVLSERIKPKDLRRSITAILDSPQTA